MRFRSSIIIVFKSITAYDVITGKDILREDWSDKKKAEWELKNPKAQRLIISSIERELLMHLLNYTSRDMFEKLIKIYDKNTEKVFSAGILQLCV